MRVTRQLVATAVAAVILAFPLGVIASHQFSDVPTSSTFHADIDAIGDAGVTTGCAAGLYCPKDYVTREQMAAFLNRLGALQDGKTPVVNADRVDDLDAGDLTRLAYDTQAASSSITKSPIYISFVTLEITAPVAGFVLVNSRVTLNNQGCTADCEVSGNVLHVQGGLASTQTITSVVFSYDTMSTTVVFEVEAGVNQFIFQLTRDLTGNGTINAVYGQMTGQFSPFAEPLP